MTLKTLGGLEFVGGEFRQAKLLLLAAYLSLEGPKPRRFMAELFWPVATDPLNSLSVALRKLQPTGLLGRDSLRVWCAVESDAQLLRAQLQSGQLEEAVTRYGGAFADGVKLDEASAELEEWLYATREALANEVRGALLTLAERHAARGQFKQAGWLAETAYRLAGASPPELAELSRLMRLLRSAEHPLAETLRREAQEFNLPEPPTPEVARGSLRRTLLGRQAELEAIQALPAGSWAWVRGGAGAGKTSLLQALEDRGWLLLPARSGLPFATLEPLLHALATDLPSEESVFRLLLAAHNNLAFDDWEAIDSDSQRVLGRLRAARPACRVVITSYAQPPFAVDQSLELGPLSALALQEYPGLLEATGGMPALVDAWLLGKPLEAALESRLAGLAPEDQRLFAALSLLDEPDLALVRAALEFTPATLASSLDRLHALGFIEPGGQVRGRPAALAHLAVHPTLQGELALRLARHLRGVQAQPLYQQARALWEDGDLDGVRRAYLAWAAELLRRGFALRAAEALADAPQSPEVTLLRARALDRAGRNLEVLELVGENRDPELLVLRAAVQVRLGQPEVAREVLEKLTVPSLEGQAERHTTLGKIALTAGNYAAAEREFRRASNKWLACGNRERWVVDLTNQAVARSMAGEHEDDAFREALEAAGNSPWSRALVLLNQAHGLSRKGQDAAAAQIGQQAVELALEAGATETAAAALYNLATYFEHLNKPQEARDTYRHCLEVAQSVNDHRRMGLSLVGLAVLDHDPEAGREGLLRLREGGYLVSAERLERFLQQFMGSSGAAF